MHENKQKEVHDQDLVLIIGGIRQKACDEFGKPLSGTESAEFRSKSLRRVMERGGISVEEARAALEGKSGSRLGEVLEAIDIIEKENEARKLQGK